jgi:hypothetical protein
MGGMNAISFAYEDFTFPLLAISFELKKIVMDIKHVQQREKEGKMGKMGISTLWSQKVIVTSTIFLHLVLFLVKVWKIHFKFLLLGLSIFVSLRLKLGISSLKKLQTLKI